MVTAINLRINYAFLKHSTTKNSSNKKCVTTQKNLRLKQLNEDAFSKNH